MALSTASNWLWNFLLAFFTPFITGAIDFRYGYVFAGCNVIAGIGKHLPPSPVLQRRFLTALGIYFFVIEGQGRTLEEIDTMYLLGVKPWESAKWVVPNLDELDPKTRRALEETNPEIAVAAQRESTGAESDGAVGSEKTLRDEAEA
jgi:SP family sugar:H+ symporter-like MFS transporter